MKKLKKITFCILIYFITTLTFAEPLIKWSDGMEIDFNFEENRWVYVGDLDEIKERIIKEIPYTYQPTNLIIIEIYRQLKKIEEIK